MNHIPCTLLLNYLAGAAQCTTWCSASRTGLTGMRILSTRKSEVRQQLYGISSLHKQLTACQCGVITHAVAAGIWLSAAQWHSY